MKLDEVHISFVNLDHRQDRRRAMEAELKRVNLPVVRTKAYRPVDVIDSIAPRHRLQVMYRRTPGAIGCHFSQVRVMKDALAAGKHAWVLEDDVKFCNDLDHRLAIIHEFCRTHTWDIIWMGGTVHIGPPHWWTMKPLKRDAEQTDHDRMLRTFGAFCTYSYIVNKDSIEKVLGGLDHWLDRSMGIDWAMIMIQPTLFTYMFMPGCCKQYDNQSDIGNGITRFSNFKNLGPYWFQNLLTDFNPNAFDWKEATGEWEQRVYPMSTVGIAEPNRVFGRNRAAQRALHNYVSRDQKKLRQQ